MEFTLKKYEQLIKALKLKGYNFQTFESFMQKPMGKVVVLRHDVDKRPENAMILATIENSNSVHASYYYRIVKGSNNPQLIKDVAKLGHEIGYHYEDLTLNKGNRKKAINSFQKNLNYFRQFYPVSTICMHGSPTSKWNNILIWEDYNYKDFEVIADPFFDVNYNQVLYLTDTGRAWNKTNASIRDKVDSKYNFNIKNIQQLIELIKNNSLPDKIIINTHPQRWHNPGFNWTKELVSQNIKNLVKRILVLKTQN